MAIILDEENKVVTVENQPDAPRAMFKNLPEASTIDGGVGDVLINGVSIVDEHGNANITQASTEQQGVVSVNGDGLQVISSGRLRVTSPTSARIKEGAQLYQPVDINHQHEAIFYGMAKAAGDTTQSLSDNAVGTYTDEAKVAIQKMLGIYEAPWELIKEGTFTNETEADYTVNTDSNNQPFELTDVRIIFRLPTQEAEASKGDYGRITLTGSIVDTSVYLGAWTQPAASSAMGGYGIVEQHSNLLETWYMRNTTEGADGNLTASYRSTGTASRYFKVLNGEDIFTEITFTAVKGTAEYAIYGRRKWR